jgi:ADP-heptose:LPS heptosyltransferase
MKEFFTSGSLGDSFIECLKLRTIKDDIKLSHFTQHLYWKHLIEEIFSFSNNVKEISFIQYEKKDVEEITSDPHEQLTDFFPSLNVKGKFKIIKPYTVLQPHSGKPLGGNTKHLPYYFIIDAIRRSPFKCVLLGTDDRYKEIDNCVNLIGQTTITDLIDIVGNSERFIGPEGLISFIALSHKIKSDIFYSTYEAVEKRIVGTPWSSFANLQNLNKIQR